MSNLNGPASSGAPESPPRWPVIIGCGNPARCDDGEGVAVILGLRQYPPPSGVQLIDAGTSGIDVMFRVRGAGLVVIVDACAGTMRCMPAARCSAKVSQTAPGHPHRSPGAGLRPGTEFPGAARRGPCGGAVDPRCWPDMDEPPRMLLREGRLHIPAGVFDGHLACSTSAALLARDGQLWLLPLLAGAGGLQIKLRNLRGDRVVESQRSSAATAGRTPPRRRSSCCNLLRQEVPFGSSLLQGDRVLGHDQGMERLNFETRWSISLALDRQQLFLRGSRCGIAPVQRPAFRT